MNSAKVYRLTTRAWYYFRIGYSTYLTFLLGYVTTLVTVYFLAIKNLPSLLVIFPDFVPFAVLGTVIGAPLSILLGWLHLKRSTAYSSEQDVQFEASPYSYKLIPGKEKEVLFPFYLELLDLQKTLLESQGLLTDEQRSRIKTLEEQIQVLMRGGYVGTPRRQRVL